MSKTTIEWTERTWNPVRGCSPVSPGCAHCYAEKTAGRFCGPGKPFDGFVQIGKNGQPGPHWTGKVELVEHMLNVPYRIRKPTTWFVNSMSDLFHEALLDESIDRVFAVMALCCAPGCSRRFNLELHPEHTFQVLTKRSRRMREYFAVLEKNRRASMMPDRIIDACHGLLRDRPHDSRNLSWDLPAWPLPNVWLGVSVEDQQRKRRIEDLRNTPAAARFLSLEPLLESLGDISCHLRTTDDESLECSECPWRGIEGEARRMDDPPDDWWFACPKCGEVCAHTPINELGPAIDWVIVGGESGPSARPFDIAWARSIVRQCKGAGVPVFVKQLGAAPTCSQDPIYDGRPFKLKDRKGGDMDEWPGDLRVRQMPAVQR